jgi:Ni/Fe-hydrogenase subunit HybB-like protein
MDGGAEGMSLEAAMTEGGGGIMDGATVGRRGFSFWRVLFWAIMAVGGVITVLRFTRGLGAVTNLSDAFPWGLWIGFDVLCGVGLAAGGFTLTAMVYIFNMQRFKPIVRATVVTAFIGYLMVVAALFFDLGKPWNLWHAIIMWNTHSVMFEVAWCVMLYTTVLALEFSGMVFEKFGWLRALRVQKAITLPLVIAGVILSTLHQSSLGAVFLIIPHKMHPLWYSPRLPYIFFLSSICVGLAMVIVESRISSRAFGRLLETSILSEIARYLVVALSVMGMLRLFDLLDRGVLGRIFVWEHETFFWWIEVFIGIVVPLAILSRARLRRHAGALYGSALCVVLGFITNRLNVSIIGLEGAQGQHYVPSWMELVISIMLVAVGFAAFAFIARNFGVFPPHGDQRLVPVTGKPIGIRIPEEAWRGASSERPPTPGASASG